MDSCSGNPKEWRFAAGSDGDGQCPFPPLAHLRGSPEFSTLWVRTAPNGPDAFSGITGSLAYLPGILVLLGQSLEATWLAIIWKLPEHAGSSRCTN